MFASLLLLILSNSPHSFSTVRIMGESSFIFTSTPAVILYFCRAPEVMLEFDLNRLFLRNGTSFPKLSEGKFLTHYALAAYNSYSSA